MRRADGEYRWLSCTGAPRLRADGTFLGYVGCSVDVTDIKASEAALREADRRKDDFLAMLGHELRNPLAGIVTGAQVLEHARPRRRGRRNAGVIARQASHMSQIVDDLLDVSRIARGKLTLRHQHVNLSQLVRDAVEDYRRSNELAREELRARSCRPRTPGPGPTPRASRRRSRTSFTTASSSATARTTSSCA